MYGAAGPPARSASAPVVRSLRRPPPPATGSVKKGLWGEEQPLRHPAVTKGILGGGGLSVASAGGTGRAWIGDTCPWRRLGL